MAKFNANVAVCPAVTVSDCDGPVTEKLSITKLMEFDAPPPGVGLDTLTPTEPVVASSVDAMLAVSVVPLFETVPACEVPLKINVEPVMNPVPVAVSGVIAVPVGAVVGEMEESTGTGLVMVKLKEFDAPPPGAGFVTTTGTTAADGNSVAGIAAVMVAPPLETTPALLVPLKLTVAPDTKLVPVMASDAIACPARAVDGLIAVIVGTGLLIVKLSELEAPPPGNGLVTMTAAGPAVITSVAGMAAVMVAPPLETTPVLLIPLKLILAPETKFEPVTVSVAIA